MGNLLENVQPVKVEVNKELLPYLKQYWEAIQAPNPGSQTSTGKASWVEITSRILYLYLTVIGRLPENKDFRELLVIAGHIHPNVWGEMRGTLNLLMLMPEFDVETGRINKEFKSSGEFHDWRIKCEKLRETEMKGLKSGFRIGEIRSSFDIHKVKYGVCDKVIDFTPRKVEKPKVVKEVKSKTITLSVDDLLSKEELREYISQQVKEKTAFMKEELEIQRVEVSNQLLELASLKAAIYRLHRDIENIKLAFGKAYSGLMGEPEPAGLNGVRAKGLHKTQQPELDLESRGNLIG